MHPHTIASDRASDRQPGASHGTSSHGLAHKNRKLTRRALRLACSGLCLIAPGLFTSSLVHAATDAKPSAALRSLVLAPGAAAQTRSVDGVVEAVRQSTLAAQVSGTIVQIEVKAGDKVRAGQLLLRIDPRASQQQSQASEAQTQAARATLQLASREYERQKQLHQQHYISQAALDQAEAQFKATQAQAQAQLAQLALSRTQGDFNLVRSPYDGVVSELPVALGDLALPGRPLLTLYDPRALRVSAALPQSQALSLQQAQAKAATPLRVELPGLAQAIAAPSWQLLPAVDAGSHTMQLRLSLPSEAELKAVVPGMFARVQLPADASPASALRVPASAVLRRAEMSVVYVLNAEGQALLRQVRLGATQGEMVEVLSGLNRGERIALDPQIAARQR